MTMSLDVAYSYYINLTKEQKLEIDKQVRKNQFELKYAIFFPFLSVPTSPGRGQPSQFPTPPSEDRPSRPVF